VYTLLLSFDGTDMIQNAGGTARYETRFVCCTSLTVDSGRQRGHVPSAASSLLVGDVVASMTRLHSIVTTVVGSIIQAFK